MTLERGALLYKRYRIVEILGQGGMGSVYRAVDENLGVDVAVKENLFTTEEYARQFRLEAVILANLRHPNLPRVTDHFVIGDQGQYLVMDYIEGEDLRQRMERMGNITEDEAVVIGAAICDALAHLHTRKPPILHRDLKPGNVKITPDGHIFLVDFGLAKVLHGSQATTTGARAMTPGYSPPEQYGTARTDPRTDIYSLGATLYAALTGIIPEDGLARAMENTQLTPLRKRNGKVSRRLAASIEKAMGIDPADRFQNAEEFKRSLLASKSKSQHLPGEYVVEPAPPDPAEENRPNAVVKAATPAAAERKPDGSQEVPQPELPVFKPPRKSKKRRGRRLLLTFFLLTLFLLSFGVVAAVRLWPEFLPAQMVTMLSPLSEIDIPFLSPVDAPTSLPTPTTASIPTDPPTDAPTEVLVAAPPTVTATLSPTKTLVPTSTTTATVDSALVPTATMSGGGLGKIAFASSRSGLPQLYLSNIDTTEQVPITTMEGGACQPSWSPDGMQLVFISPCPGRSEFNDKMYAESSLYVINVDGTGLRALTSVPGSDFDPAWSPDGTKIAFTSVRNGFRQIFSLDVESQAVTLLTNTDKLIESSQPAWSPDGKRIAYMVFRLKAYQVWAMDADGQNAVQLVRSGQNLMDYLPAWSPDGLIYFSQRPSGAYKAALMQVNSETLDQGPNRLEISSTSVEDISLSPDGLWVAFESMDGSGNRDIYYMSLAGSGRTRLTSDAKIDFDPAWRPSPGP